MNEIKNYPRKRERGLRVSGHLSVPASREVEKFREELGTRVTEILSNAMIWYGKFMRGEIATTKPPHLNSPAPAFGRPPKGFTATDRALHAAKSLWCEEFGGKCENELCIFDKFEVTLAGTTEMSKRTIALAEMPENKDDFKKLMLGGYANVFEARRAVEGKE